jgi:hypothetical protein
MTKINVNVAVGKNSGCCFVVATAHGNTRLYLGSSVDVFPRKMDTKILEALACQEVVSLAKDISARVLRVASDSSNVIVNLEQCTTGVYAHIVQEILESAENFKTQAFVHQRRILNKRRSA